ncbi:MAG: PQQ-binding-like beta-propeller repeat protein [Solobacterium sp.]|nr:PQQ-binding-like beta-propeller repeat protein [Solobacterium sp.]
MDTVSEERSYIAFISYRHKPLDKQAAEMIQKKIEHFKVPEEYREAAGGKSLGKVFRDEDELPASSSLSGSITYALDHSRFLIVICTPDLPLSHWCEEEIRYFLSTHDRDHVLAVLADGTPDVSFSPYLLHIYDEDGNIIKDTEPLAANIAGPNHTIDRKAFNKEIVRIYAALLGCPFDALWQRERRDRTNRIVRIMGVILAAMSIFIAVVLSQNKQIQSQNRSLQKQLSSSYVESGQKKLEEYRTKEALSDAVHALLDGSDEELIDPRTEKLLGDALGIYMDQDPRSSLLYEQTPAITSLKATAKGDLLFIADEYGYVRGIDGETGTVRWETPTLLNVEQMSNIPSRLEYLEQQNVLLCKNPADVTAIDPDTGDVLWQYIYHTENQFLTISGNQDVCVLAEKEYSYRPPTDFMFIDTVTGRELQKITIENEETSIRLSSTFSTSASYNGTFSENMRYFACIVYEDPIENSLDKEGVYRYYILDTENGEIVHEATADDPTSSPQLVYGMYLNDTGDYLFCARYNSRYGSIVVTLLDFVNNHFENKLTDATIHTSHGEEIMVMDYSEVRTLPMLYSEYLAIVFNQNTMYIYRLDDGTLIKNIEMSGDILEARWTDREEEKLFLLLSTGTAIHYDLGHEGTVFEEMVGTYLDQKNIYEGVSADDGFLLNEESGFYYTVPDEQRSRVISIHMASDPFMEELADQPETKNNVFHLLFSPSGEKIFTFWPVEEGMDVLVYDLDGKVTDHAHFADLESNMPIAVIDNTRFVQERRIYNISGTEAHLEGLSDEEIHSFYYNIVHVSDTEGRVLSCGEAGINSGYGVRFWINGEPSEYECEDTFPFSPEVIGGKNGWFLLLASSYDQNSTVDQCVMVDVVNQTRSVVDLGTEKENIEFYAMGEHEPVFAAVRKDGGITIYDVPTSESVTLDTTYSAGEIHAVCFGEDDRDLLVLTGAGKLDIYRRESGEMIFSTSISPLKYGRISYIDPFSVRNDPEHHRMYILPGRTYYSAYEQMIVVDTDTWTVLSETYSVYDWCSANEKIYAYRNGKKVNFPAYHREELTQWAKEVTGE